MTWAVPQLQLTFCSSSLSMARRRRMACVRSMVRPNAEERARTEFFVGSALCRSQSWSRTLCAVGGGGLKVGFSGKGCREGWV